MITILTTGGTIEGLEYDKIDKAPEKAPISIEDHLSRIDIAPQYDIKEVFSKDSRFVNRRDRDLLLREIEFAENDKIIITHGTLTMVETALFLGKLNLDKTIVLTGAFVLGTDPKTDAFENLSFALTKVSSVEKGVYIAMHQTLFPWNNVQKNMQENRFEKIKK